MKIVWSPLSLQQIEEISDYIAVDNRSAACDWIDSIFEKVDVLKTNPEIGRRVAEIEKPDIRELIHVNYRIIYLYTSKKILILTIRHFKQLLPTEEIIR